VIAIMKTSAYLGHNTVRSDSDTIEVSQKTTFSFGNQEQKVTPNRSAQMRTAKYCLYFLLTTAALNTFPLSLALSQNPYPEKNIDAQHRSSITNNSHVTVQAARHPQMTEDVDGELSAGEFTVISPNGSITRALCPYSCDMRGLPKNFCKSWRSKSASTLCYLQDTRIPSSAVE
jgi:hypothetical protein